MLFLQMKISKILTNRAQIYIEIALIQLFDQIGYKEIRYI